MGLLDSLFLYQSEWTEFQKRTFEAAEIEAIKECIVVSSKWGKSVQFTLVNGKKYIPLEPTTTAGVGDILDPGTLEIVSLKYTGTDQSRLGKTILRVRVAAPQEEATFDNPLGIL